MYRGPKLRKTLGLGTAGGRGSGLDLNLGVFTFFDQPSVERAVNRAERKVLVQQGSYVRMAARNRIQDKPGSAKPGHSPHTDLGPYNLRDSIFYAYDPREVSVAIGPEVNNPGRDIPGLLEFGGIHPTTGNRYNKFPYMGPALKASEPFLAKFWEDSVKG